jgi:hypothetical protein
MRRPSRRPSPPVAAARHGHGAAARSPAPGDPARRAIPDAALVVVAALLAAGTFAGELAYGFAQDDFVSLARVHGLVAPLHGAWRWLSGTFYFRAMGALGGLSPLPYRVVTLVAHAACVTLVYAWCRRRTGRAGALVGATFFGCHPALFTALYSVSGIGEILAALFGVAALLAARRDGGVRWLALPLFAVSLLAKESTLLLPLVAAADALLPLPADVASAKRAAPTPTPIPRLVVPAALAALAVAAAVTLFSGDAFGVRHGVDASAAYALGSIATVRDNLLTYLGWTTRIGLPWVRSFADAVDPGVFTDGVVVAMLWLAGLAVPALRRRGWLVGGVLFVAWIAPVLPLAHHTYHYYLYAPLAGTALAVAALADGAFEWLGAGRLARRAAAIAPAAIVVLLAVNGAMLVRKIERYPFVDPELRADPTVDRARIAANVLRDLNDPPPPPGAALWFWSPIAAERARLAGADSTRTSYWETNVQKAIAGDLAIRLYHPDVHDVRFVREFTPAPDSVRYAVYRPDGHLKLGSPRELEGALSHQAAGGRAP